MAGYNFANDQYYEILCKNSGKFAAVSAGSTSDGANIIQWTRHNGDNQKWSFTAVETIPLPAVQNMKTLPDIPKYTPSPNEVLPAQTTSMSIGADAGKLKSFPFLCNSNHKCC